VVIPIIAAVALALLVLVLVLRKCNMSQAGSGRVGAASRGQVVPGFSQSRLSSTFASYNGSSASSQGFLTTRAILSERACVDRAPSGADAFAGGSAQVVDETSLNFTTIPSTATIRDRELEPSPSCQTYEELESNYDDVMLNPSMRQPAYDLASGLSASPAATSTADGGGPYYDLATNRGINPVASVSIGWERTAPAHTTSDSGAPTPATSTSSGVATARMPLVVAPSAAAAAVAVYDLANSSRCSSGGETDSYSERPSDITDGGGCGGGAANNRAWFGSRDWQYDLARGATSTVETSTASTKDGSSPYDLAGGGEMEIGQHESIVVTARHGTSSESSWNAVDSVARSSVGLSTFTDDNKQRPGFLVLNSPDSSSRSDLARSIPPEVQQDSEPGVESALTMNGNATVAGTSTDPAGADPDGDGDATDAPAPSASDFSFWSSGHSESEDVTRLVAQPSPAAAASHRDAPAAELSFWSSGQASTAPAQPSLAAAASHRDAPAAEFSFWSSGQVSAAPLQRLNPTVQGEVHSDAPAVFTFWSGGQAPTTLLTQTAISASDSENAAPPRPDFEPPLEFTFWSATPNAASGVQHASRAVLNHDPPMRTAAPGMVQEQASPEKGQPGTNQSVEEKKNKISERLVGKLLPMRELVDEAGDRVGRDRDALRTDAQVHDDFYFTLSNPLRAADDTKFDRPGIEGAVTKKIVLPSTQMILESHLDA
jgi:hypothetical protein